MKRLIYVFLLTLLASCAMAESTEDIKASRRYQVAIANAEVRQGPDRRPELERCIKHWDVLRIERAGSLNDATGEGRSVLLEIGNSGFPRYDYIRIDDFSLTSSYTAAIDVSKSALGKRLMEIYANHSLDFRGSADSEIDDGDCYYLTVNGSGLQESIAVYGAPESTPSGLLIKEMLKTAQKSKAP